MKKIIIAIVCLSLMAPLDARRLRRQKPASTVQLIDNALSAVRNEKSNKLFGDLESIIKQIAKNEGKSVTSTPTSLGHITDNFYVLLEENGYSDAAALEPEVLALLTNE